MAAEKQTTWWEHLKSHSGTETDRRNQYRLLGWTLAWAVVFVGASFLLRSDEPRGGWSWVIATIPIVLALGPGAAYLRFLRGADELMRRIQMESLAFGFGAGVVFAFGWQLLQRAGAPAVDVGDTVVVMMVGFVVGQLLAIRRYR